jgi:hypothetical protein
MIIISTHKRHKSPSEHPKTIYVFTFGPIIIIVQIEKVKMTNAKSPSIHEHIKIYIILLQD